MYKLYKKDGTEVQFATEEGMLKTLEAFPDKYSQDEIKPEEVISGNAAPDGDIEAKILELVEQGYSREYAEQAVK